MTTTWTKNAKESFVDAINETVDESVLNATTKVGNDVANFGNDVYIGKDTNELILNSPLKNLTADITVPPDVTIPPSLNDQINDLKSNFNPKKANDVWQNIVSSLEDGIGDPFKNIAKKLLSLIYKDFETPSAKNDLKTLSIQISRWFKIVIASYIVALNWWYIWCYTTFTFDLRSLIFLQPNPILAPAINAFEVLNYYLINMRMDSEPKLPAGLGNEDIRKLWHWRPITFSILHFITILIFLSSHLFKGLSSIFKLATNSAIYYLAIGLTFYYYFVLYKTWYKIPLSLSGGVVGLLLLIATTILTILSVGIVVPICLLFFTMYLSFLSNTSLFAFNWFWPPSIYSTVKQIFQELKEAPVGDDNPPDTTGKVGNYLFQNFHNIYIVVIVLFPLLIWNITESAKFSNDTLIVIGILVNILMFFLFSWSGFKDVIKLILVMFGVDVGSAADPTEPAPGQPVPQTQPTMTQESVVTDSNLPSPSAPPLPEPAQEQAQKQAQAPSFFSRFSPFTSNKNKYKHSNE